MRLRTIRNIISLGAALGFAHGGWGSCSQALTEIGSAATLPHLSSPNLGTGTCPRGLLSVVGSQTQCIVHQPLVGCLAADEDENIRQQAFQSCNRHSVERGLVGADAFPVRKDELQRQAPALGWRVQPSRGIPWPRPATSEEQTHAERIAREQATRDRIASERIARQQEEANKRAVARIVREQAEINRRESKRIEREQALRDRLAIERIKRRQAVADQRAVDALLKRQQLARKVFATASDQGSGIAAWGISKRWRALQVDRIKKVLRKPTSILERAHLPR